jgi:hypothetical protein
MRVRREPLLEGQSALTALRNVPARSQQSDEKKLAMVGDDERLVPGTNRPSTSSVGGCSRAGEKGDRQPGLKSGRPRAVLIPCAEQMPHATSCTPQRRNTAAAFFGASNAFAVLASAENDPKVIGRSRKCCLSASTRC